MCPAIIALSEIRHTRVALSEMKRFGVKTILDIRIFAYDCGPCRARSWDIFKYWGQLSEETVRAMKKLWNLTVVHTGYSCYLSLDMGPGAAACGMEIEINTGYSCYLSVVRRSRGRFFSPIGSGPGGSSLWNGDRDKHWVQLLFIRGSSSPGAVFFSYWIWARGQRLVEWG